jgi:hypothetical protein
MILRKIKKSLGTCLVASIVIATFVGCSKSQAEVVVIENQQQEIKDVLSVKSINKLEGFKSIRWITDKKLIGLRDENGIRNIYTYNIEDSTFSKVSNNTKSIKDVDINIINQSVTEECKYVLYKEYLNKDEHNRFSLYCINVDNKKVTYIGSGIHAVSKIENNKFNYTKGIRVFEYDLVTGKEKEIKLPETLVSEMKEFPSTFEGYLDSYNIPQNERKDEVYMKSRKNNYEYTKKYYDMVWIERTDDILTLRTPNLATTEYNLLTHEFHITKKDIINYHKKDSIIRKIGLAKLIDKGQTGDEFELWRVDSDGNDVELIDKASIIKCYLSPDEQKLAYKSTRIDGSKLYIYNFKTDKKISVSSSDIDSAVFWNKNSNKFIFLSSKGKMTLSNVTTYIVTLN